MKNKYWNKFFLCGLAVLFFYNPIYSFNKDSVINTIKAKHNNPTNEINEILEIANTYFYNDNSVAKELIFYAMNYCKQNNLDTSLANTLNYYGIYYETIEQFDSALMQYDKAFVLFKKHNNLKGIGSVYNNKGLIYWNQSNLDKAQEFFFKALKEFDKIKNFKKMASVYNNLSLVNNEANNYYEAIKNCHKAIYYYKLAKEEKSIGAAYNNLASAHEFLDQFDSSTKYFLLSINLHEKINNNYGLSIALSGLAASKLQQKKYSESEKYLNKAIALKIKIEDSIGLISSYIQKAALMNNNSRNDAAIYYIKIAQDVAMKKNMPKKLIAIKNNMALYYSKNGQYKEAYELMAEFALLNDSIKSIETQEHIQLLSVKYETEKQESQILNQKLEISRKNILLISAILLMLVLSLLVWFFVRNMRNKNAKELKEKLLHEKLENAQELIFVQEKQRRQIGSDIHDGIGQLLSAAKINLQTLDDTQLQEPALQKTFFILDQCSKETRSLAHSLMPYNLNEGGLLVAIHELASLTQTNNLNIQIETFGFHVAPNSAMEIIVYRTIQEALQNIVKHAKATEIKIQLEENEQEMIGIIEDNGIGFEKTNAALDGFGLKNMETRIQLLNGSFDIESELGQGTRITFTVPHQSLADEK